MAAVPSMFVFLMPLVSVCSGQTSAAAGIGGVAVSPGNLTTLKAWGNQSASQCPNCSKDQQPPCAGCPAACPALYELSNGTSGMLCTPTGSFYAVVITVPIVAVAAVVAALAGVCFLRRRWLRQPEQGDGQGNKGLAMKQTAPHDQRRKKNDYTRNPTGHGQQMQDPEDPEYSFVPRDGGQEIIYENLRKQPADDVLPASSSLAASVSSSQERREEQAMNDDLEGMPSYRAPAPPHSSTRASGANAAKMKNRDPRPVTSNKKLSTETTNRVTGFDDTLNAAESDPDYQNLPARKRDHR